MKFWSVLKLSLHNLANNKLRTFLTIVVLFIMASVVMIMTGFGMSFFNSIGASTEKSINESDSFVTISENISGSRDGYTFYGSASYLDEDVKQKAVDFYNSEENYFHTIEFSSEQRTMMTTLIDFEQHSLEAAPMYMGSNLFVGQSDYLVSGRLWSISDEGTNNVWLSASLSDTFKLGSEIEFDDHEGIYNVCGFLKSDNDKIYMDYKLFNDTTLEKSCNFNGDYNNELVIGKITLTMKQIDNNKFDDGTVKNLQDFTKSFNSVSDYDEVGIYVESNILDSLKFALIMKIVIVAVLVFVAVLIILLSIGSVSNTIKITVEQNRKFFGMMKAIGMQNKIVRRVVQWQAIIMVALGTILATGVTIGAMYLVGPLVAMMMNSLFGCGAVIITGLPLYAPFVVFFALVLFVLLFTVKNLNKISKMDVISVISEVN